MQAYPQRHSSYYGQDDSCYDSGAMAAQPQMYNNTPSSHQGHGYGYNSHGQGQLHSSSFKMSSSQSHQMLTVFGSDPFCEIKPSAFPPGTDPKVVECFNRLDVNRNGVIDDRELQGVLSSYNHCFSLRTVHLLMYEFTHSNKRMIGPREFLPLLKCLQTWKSMFQRFDRDRNGSIDSMELGQALNGLGFCVSPIIVNLLIAKFNKSGGYGRCSLQYDQFIECCLTVKGLTETFNAKADQRGKAYFCYEEFLLNVLPFIIA